MRYRSAIKRLASVWKTPPPSDGPSIQLAGHRISQLTLRGESKAGHIWWSGWVGNTRVKLYETASPGCAALVQQISSNAELALYFPRVLGTESQFVLAEWMDGNPVKVNAEGANAAGRILGAFHRAVVDGTGGFDYAEFLVMRLRRYAGPFLAGKLEAVAEEGSAALEALTPRGPRLSHPDITHRNLVLPKGGTTVAIDNELVGVGCWYPLDLINAWASFRSVRTAAQEILSGYRSGGGDPDILADAGRNLYAAWRLRSVGSSLEAGQLDKALDATDLNRHARDLEPLLRAVS